MDRSGISYPILCDIRNGIFVNNSLTLKLPQMMFLFAGAKIKLNVRDQTLSSYQLRLRQASSGVKK